MPPTRKDAPAVQGSPLGNPGQQRKRRRDGEDGESDSESGTSGKRLQQGGDGSAGGQARGDGVSNEEIMSVLRSIKESLSGLNVLKQINAGASSLHAQPAQDSGMGLSAPLSASEEALGSLLKRAGEHPPPPSDNMGYKQAEDTRIGVVGQMSADDSTWDHLEADAVEEVFKEMWSAMHPTIQLAEGQDEGSAAADGKKTSKRPLTLQAKKKYIRRNVKVAIEGVKSKLQVLACCPWITFMFGHCDVTSTSPSFLKAGQLMWSRHNLSEDPSARYVPREGLDHMKSDGYESWSRRLHNPALTTFHLPHSSSLLGSQPAPSLQHQPIAAPQPDVGVSSQLYRVIQSGPLPAASTAAMPLSAALAPPPPESPAPPTSADSVGA